MTRYIFYILLSILMLVPLSCANRKVRHKAHDHRQETAYREVSRSDSARAVQLRAERQLSASKYRETYIITPSGPFTYHPDSGYRGRASRVAVQREGNHIQGRIVRDSLVRSRQRRHDSTGGLAIRQSQSLQHSDKRQIPWRWVAGLLLLGLGGLYLFNRLRR